MEGQNAGQPVALNCTWYNIPIDREDELIEIPGAKSACYQPSVEDIGHKVFVHAVPVCDNQDEYLGMPLLQAIGPIVMDPNIQRRLDTLVIQNPAVLGKVTLD